MPVMPREPSMPNTEEARLAAPQGADRPGPSNFGVDYDGEPVADDANHVQAMAAVNQGRPTVEQQMHTHGQAPPKVPDTGKHA